jgi:hypothetical protein
MRTAATAPPPVDWLAIAAAVGDLALPVLSILVPTIIAVLLFRAERKDAREADARGRRRDASADVIVALAPMISLQPDEPMQPRLWELRARIAVYRSWIERDDLSGDWLALRHREGMVRFSHVMTMIDAAGGPSKLSVDAILDIMSPAHQWAATTLDMLSLWIRGDLPESELRNDGARILEEFGPPPQSQPVPSAPDLEKPS